MKSTWSKPIAHHRSIPKLSMPSFAISNQQILELRNIPRLVNKLNCLVFLKLILLVIIIKSYAHLVVESRLGYVDVKSSDSGIFFYVHIGNKSSHANGVLRYTIIKLSILVVG